MTSEPEQPKQRQDEPRSRRRARKSVWDDADIVINIEHTEPGTALDDHLRKEQTRAVLDLLANYKQKLDGKDNERL